MGFVHVSIEIKKRQTEHLFSRVPSVGEVVQIGRNRFRVTVVIHRAWDRNDPVPPNQSDALIVVERTG